MTLLNAYQWIPQQYHMPLHHIPTMEERVKASQRFDKGVLIFAHMAALRDSYIMEMATHPVDEVSIKPSSPTSSLCGHKPHTLRQLKLGKLHRHGVVYGTLCVQTLCSKTASPHGPILVNVLEDDDGDAISIHLCNAMEGNGGSAQAQRLLPHGCRVGVKNPYLTTSSDGQVVLMVEKSTDLVFLWVPEHGVDSGIGDDDGDEMCIHKNTSKNCCKSGHMKGVRSLARRNENKEEKGDRSVKKLEDNAWLLVGEKESRRDDKKGFSEDDEDAKSELSSIGSDQTENEAFIEADYTKAKMQNSKSNPSEEEREEGADKEKEAEEEAREEDRGNMSSIESLGPDDEDEACSESSYVHVNVDAAEHSGTAATTGGNGGAESNNDDDSEEEEDAKSEISFVDVLDGDERREDDLKDENAQHLGGMAEMEDMSRSDLSYVDVLDDDERVGEGEKEEEEEEEEERVRGSRGLKADKEGNVGTDMVVPKAEEMHKDVVVGETGGICNDVVWANTREMHKDAVALGTGEMHKDVVALETGKMLKGLPVEETGEMERNAGAGKTGEMREEDATVEEAEQMGDPRVGDQNEALQRTESGSSLRTKGNSLFRRGEYLLAAEMYKRAAEAASRGGAGEKEERMMSLSNRAEVWLCVGEHAKALEDAEAALAARGEAEVASWLAGVESEDGMVSVVNAAQSMALLKALFRKGRALFGLGRVEDALLVFQLARRLAPTHEHIIDHLAVCRQRIASHAALEPGKRRRLRNKAAATRSNAPSL